MLRHISRNRIVGKGREIPIASNSDGYCCCCCCCCPCFFCLCFSAAALLLGSCPTVSLPPYICLRQSALGTWAGRHCTFQPACSAPGTNKK